MSRPQESDAASLRRMLEDKIALERAFGVEVIGRAKPDATPVESAPAVSVTPFSPRPPQGGEGKGEGAKTEKVELPANASKAERLAALNREMADCHECPLASTRMNLVFGDGSAEAELMFVGEAPGADEDAQGLPFVGRAGQLLNRMIIAMGLKREDVYIANILKCRPPGNRQPRPDEVIACIPYLKRQIAIIQPKLIVCLGGVAAHNLLQNEDPVGRLRNQWHEYEGVPLLVTFHPAYLLRSPGEKAKAWEDMKTVLNKLGKPVPK